jgi:hypothetical protein
VSDNYRVKIHHMSYSYQYMGFTYEYLPLFIHLLYFELGDLYFNFNYDHILDLISLETLMKIYWWQPT